MAPREFEEKRDFMRMAVECEVSYRTEADEQEHRGRVKNLSGRGLLFDAEQALDVGQMLDLSVHTRGGTVAPLEARAEVVRVEAVEPERLYEIGVVFQSVR